jgi:hypothetical protein
MIAQDPRGRSNRRLNPAYDRSTENPFDPDGRRVEQARRGLDLDNP